MFKVPEASRVGMLSHPLDGNNGVFLLSSPEPGWTLVTLASDGLGWEHVSVRATRRGKDRIPTWKEMSFAKDSFWGAEDEVIQIHPKRSNYVNLHPCVLHLWRPVEGLLPMPDPLLVGPRSKAEAHAVAAISAGLAEWVD